MRCSLAGLTHGNLPLTDHVLVSQPPAKLGAPQGCRGTCRRGWRVASLNPQPMWDCNMKEKQTFLVLNY